jgi:hypothetical protein
MTNEFVLMLPPTVSWQVCVGIKHPPGAYDQIFYYCETVAGVAGMLVWGALSNERACVSVTIAASPGQCSHFRVRVPWNS